MGKYSIGVMSFGNKFKSYFHKKGKSKSLGVYNSLELAFNAYKKAKEDYIKEKANEYYNKGLITEDVYIALYNYKVEITD